MYICAFFIWHTKREWMSVLHYIRFTSFKKIKTLLLFPTLNFLLMVSNAHKESFVVIQNRKIYISCYEHFQGLKRQDYLHQWSKERGKNFISYFQQIFWIFNDFESCFSFYTIFFRNISMVDSIHKELIFIKSYIV